jgi:hypothetical protein
MHGYFLLVASSIAAIANAASAVSSPGDGVRIGVKEHYGSLHEQSCIVDLTLTNNHDFPVWFVLSHGNRLLPYDGTFAGRGKHSKIPFKADEYNEGKGSAICVYSFTDDYFNAFLLPPRGRLHFAGFVITDFHPLRFVDVWEVKSLKVNGKTNLEEWLPYPVMSSKTVEIAGSLESGRQQVLGVWSKKDPKAKPYPDEKPETLKADPIRRQVIPLPE